MHITPTLARCVTGISLVLTTAIPLYAQRIGIMAGATYSNLRSSDDLELKNRTGSIFGVSLQFPVGQKITLQPELQFLNKGAEFRPVGVRENSGNVRLDYVEIPLLLRYDFARTIIGPHVYIGPSVGWNVGCEARYTSTDTEAAPFTTDCDDDGFKPKTLDYGLTAGAGVDLNFGGIGATAGLRYGIGLADIRQDNKSQFRNRVHNGVLSLYAGVLLGSFR